MDIGRIRVLTFPGYQDSGADIAYALRQKGIRVLTPTPSPSDSSHEGWSFPDTAEGIYSAVQQGATHLWANTTLFASHALQTSSQLTPLASNLHIVGQPPRLVEDFDDKCFLNNKLRELGGFTLPRAWMVHPDNLPQIVKQIDRYPVVGKPVRGRGSHGVRVCHDAAQLQQHAESLLAESSLIMLEEFLTGEEATITVMPPTPSRLDYWSMVPVTRFNHANGIAPYNGLVAVTSNSRAVSEEEMRDPAYNKVMRQCEGVARLIGATAPIRIDVRRFQEGSEFALFDINMKPVGPCFSLSCKDTERLQNMTGPGRPGREDQASLTAIAAEAMGWDYGTLLQRILESAQPLGRFRNYRSPFQHHDLAIQDGDYHLKANSSYFR